jgi:hypothetical protein
MRKNVRIAVVLGAAVAAIGLLVGSSSGARTDPAPPLTVADGSAKAHLFPTASAHRALALGTPPLTYNGGPVMLTATTYAIYWLPPTLQDGTPAGTTKTYQALITRFLKDYAGHGVANNNTQYYQSIAGTKYIQSKGAFGGAYVDTSVYPASGCIDPQTPHGCLSDAQLQAEISKAMALKGWTGGLGHMFLLFTSNGEGSCYAGMCAYRDYCAYHSYFGSSSDPVVYSNQPYGDTSVCQISPTPPSPTGDAVADTAITAASHELTEAITDPELDAWFDTSGYEIADECAYSYAPLTWDGGIANQSWNGHYYLLQTEWDNHSGSCVSVGP